MSFSEAELAFRDEVRAFLADAMPPEMKKKAEADGNFSHDESMQWHKILHEKGWIAPHWPAEVGGAALDVTRRFILTEELELAGTPQLSPFGLAMVGPLLIQFGSDAQKKRYLPKILSGEEVWCQGYSEPNAGSDLAALRLSAVDDGKGNFVLNGQKTWTTYAQYADWIFLLVRTDPDVKKQAGISFLLADMKTPGITVKPMLTSGGTPAFCETFFEDAVVPKENLVGPLNGGWTLAKALLGHERTLIAAVGQSTRTIRRLKRLAAQTKVGGGTLMDDPAFRNRIALHEIKLEALRATNYRAIAGAALGHAPGPESSILKIRGSEILQQCFEIAMEIMAHNSLEWFNEEGTVPDNERWVPSAFNYTRATTIYGGSNEIQRNVIAKWILQLPSN
ncbi:MAG: acyl-CoA dehydrogenase family protein [Polyangiaceae bacterium]